MPVCAYSLRMSTTSGPTLPWYTGKSILGLPLLKDRVALLSASFMVGSFSCIRWGGHRADCLRAQQVQNFKRFERGGACFRGGIRKLAGFLALEQQIQQIIVSQVH